MIKYFSGRVDKSEKSEITKGALSAWRNSSLGFIEASY